MGLLLLLRVMFLHVGDGETLEFADLFFVGDDGGGGVGVCVQPVHIVVVAAAVVLVVHCFELLFVVFLIKNI